ncbi:MAG: thioredoxin domain-containing protein [Xanthomonadales bacterium]|nr:thioredoxin domain-containing protein [Xanthomonadales bacterium]NIN60153.1 thioredoxin domain-containing protein [Xanthomonadales bacterium]NIN74300.1 thioredoxin domain-containing protein [Xanthomonadales bacterium]NIO12809.1 thioredoxin domain-containing protein [Xanthomonadales bacterium]NIP12546.1 thioredoxin domain-containing protein [Xanthomonadales bacterium]
MKHLALMGTLLWMCGAGSAWAQAETQEPFQEGVHYVRIDQAPAPRDIVEVTEVFSYRCSHCNTFEPYMQAWNARKPAGVELTRIPVVFGRRDWELYARAYVTASVMGIAEQTHVPMMDAIWKERRDMRSMEALADFYAGFGVTREQFLATAESFAVDAQMRREQRQVQIYGVTGTPTLIVNGQFRVAGNQAVPSYDDMLRVVDYLVARELAALESTPAADS